MRTRIERHTRGFRTTIVVLYADIRGFSDWSRSARPGEVARLVEACYERVVQLHVDFHHNFHRLLGDGFVLVWETDEFEDPGAADTDRTVNALRCAVNASQEIHKKYFYLRKILPFKTPLGYGISIVLGLGYRVRLRTGLSQLNEDDYTGYPMILGARLQRFAGPGETIIAASAIKLCQRYSEDLLRTKYPGFELQILRPSIQTGEKTNGFKGLNKRDKSGFRLLRREGAMWELSN